jgi:hypothetical protein
MRMGIMGRDLLSGGLKEVSRIQDARCWMQEHLKQQMIVKKI